MSSQSKGFSLVEVAVILVIAGLCFLLLVPQMMSSQERTKASEAFHALEIVKKAQLKYHERAGVYASDLKALKLPSSPAHFFEFGIIEAGESGSLKDSWSLTMTRKTGNGFKGEYTVTFTEKGFAANDSTITDLPGINPVKS